MPEFIRAVKCGMSNERVTMTIDLFHRFVPIEPGVVAADEIYSSYDCASHPNVSTGKTSLKEAQRVIQTYLQNGVYVPGHFTVSEFLDFCLGISLMIDDDELFELTVRNSWYSSARGVGLGNTSTVRRFNVAREDGGADTMEIRDDLSVQVFDKFSVTNKLQRRGISDVMDIKIN